MNRTRSAPAALLAAAVAVVLAACAQPSPEGTTEPAPTESSAPALDGSITVNAAASLNKVFPELADAFTADHPGVDIAFNFGGSSTLAAQIVNGAPIDVFAAASTTTMATVTDADLAAAEPVIIARNQLQIAVPPGNPGGIDGLADFADESKTIVVCDPEVPCGAAAEGVFELGGIDAKPDSLEPDVTSVLTKVREDEADAGLVYVTDVLAAGDEVEGITFPESDDAITDYPIAPLTGSQNPELAAAFTEYVIAEGGPALIEAGFLAPQ